MQSSGGDWTDIRKMEFQVRPYVRKKTDSTIELRNDLEKKYPP